MKKKTEQLAEGDILIDFSVFEGGFMKGRTNRDDIRFAEFALVPVQKLVDRVQLDPEYETTFSTADKWKFSYTLVISVKKGTRFQASVNAYALGVRVWSTELSGTELGIVLYDAEKQCGDELGYSLGEILEKAEEDKW